LFITTADLLEAPFKLVDCHSDIGLSETERRLSQLNVWAHIGRVSFQQKRKIILF